MQRYKLLLLALFLVTLFGFISCKKRDVAPPPQREYLNHVISYQGETLTVISSWYTGSGQNWRIIADSNPGLRPNRLRPGMVVRIPRVLLTRDTPLPQSYVVGAMAKSRSADEKQDLAFESGGAPADASVVQSQNGSLTEGSGTTTGPSISPPQFEETSVIDSSGNSGALPTSGTESSGFELPDPGSAPASLDAAPSGTQPSDSVAADTSVAGAVAQQPKDQAKLDEEAERQKTRDELLKELMQDY